MEQWPFNRSVLRPALQTSYDAIASAMFNRQESVKIPETALYDLDLESVYDAVKNDKTLLFDAYIKDYTCFSDGRIISLKLGYRMNDSMYHHTVMRIMSEAEYILSDIDDLHKMSDIEKVEAIHDLLISRITYHEHSSNSDDAHTVAGVMLTNSGVCDGIAHTVSLLLNMVGIKTSVISGKIMGSSTGHAWDIVEIDGRRGHLDLGFDVIWRVPYPTYEYFLISDKELSKTRVWEPKTQCMGFKSYYDRHSVRVCNEKSFVETFRREHQKSDSFIMMLDGELSSFDDYDISRLTNVASDWSGPDEMYVYPGGEVRFVFR